MKTEGDIEMDQKLSKPICIECSYDSNNRFYMRCSECGIKHSKVEENTREPESSGGSCDYYKVLITHPTTATEEYVAECNDVIEALGMTYAESNIFKEIWRSAAGRTLGKEKAGHDSSRGADKIIFFANRNKVQKDNQCT